MADDEVPAHLRSLPWHSVIRIPQGSNSNALWKTIELALDYCADGDSVYLVEQDYLHTLEARAALADGIALNPEGYVTLFDDPLYYWPSADVGRVQAGTQLKVGTTRHWRTVPSTTMTFAAPSWVLEEDRSVFHKSLIGTDKPPDRKLWRSLTRAGRVLLSSVPAAASHIETTALAPFVDWRSLGEAKEVVSLPSTALDWRHGLAGVAEVAVGRAVSAVVRRQLRQLGVQTVTLNLKDACTRTEPWWAVVTAKEKDMVDNAVRSRGTALVGMIVAEDAVGYSGRWYSGRDWFLTDLLEAKTAQLPTGR